jgi:hypothetical protein
VGKAPNLTDRPDVGDGPGPDRDRLPWIPPEVIELPPLTQLTLQSTIGDPIGGGGGTGGGTVFN